MTSPGYLRRSLLALWLLPVAAGAHPGHHSSSSNPVPANQNPPGKNEVSITEQDGYRYITSNGIPEGKVGAFPNQGNPNSMSAQRYRFRVPLQPTKADRLTPLPMQDFGVALNGVPFDPNAAEWWNNDRNSGWRREAFYKGTYNLGIDANLAHVQPSGAYHYHGVPTDLMPKPASQQMTLVGYAADGFPIYGVYGYRDPSDAKSGVKELKPSYRLKKGQRPGGGSSPDGKYTGEYTKDFEYVPGLGDLDEANGRTGVTPEYPSGTYYYVVTHGFPYVPRYWVGTPDASFSRHMAGGRRQGNGRPGGHRGGPPGGRAHGPGGHGHPPPHHPPR